MPHPENKGLPANHVTKRVLVLEDSLTVTLFVRTLLEQWGYAVGLAAANNLGLPGLGDYQLVVVDAAWPDADAVVSACVNHAIPVLALISDGARLRGTTAEVALPIKTQDFRLAVMHCMNNGIMRSLAEAGIDVDEIIALWGTVDDAKFLRVASVFVAELEERLPLIRQLLAIVDRVGLERQAHSIKGAASNVGATAIQAIAFKLETLSLTGSAEELAQRITELHTIADAGIMRLRTLINSGPN